MNRPFKLTDIVVFDGIISTFGVFYALDIAVVDNFRTQIRHATKEEIDLYKNRPDS